MARPRKKGLDYFPFDVDFFSDKKIKRLRAKYGSDGVAVYLYLLCEIYHSGYYIEYDEDLILDISDELNIRENSTMQILNYLFSRSLLQLIERKLAVPVKVITASSIQRRYQEAKKGAKHDIEVEGEFWVLKKEETESFIKVRPVDGFSENNESFSEKNGDKSEKNHTKESKVKKSKVKESKEKTAASPSCPVGLSENDFSQLYSDYGKEIIDKYREKINNWQEKSGKTVSDPAELIRKWLVQDNVPKLPNIDKYKEFINRFD